MIRARVVQLQDEDSAGRAVERGCVAVALQVARTGHIYLCGAVHGYALAGHRQEAMALLEKMLSDSTGADEGNRWVHAACIQVGLGDKSAALTGLENSYARHKTDVNYIGVDAIFDPLRKEPRFQALLKKLGL